MSIGISDGLGGRDGRIGSSHTGNLYLYCLEGGLPPKGGMAVGGGQQGTIGGSAGLDCGCVVGSIWSSSLASSICSSLASSR